MSGDVSDRKRLISVNSANLRNAHLYISGHHDFFPPESYGASKEKDGLGREITLLVEGLPEPIKTDIAKDASNGRPRGFFRRRRWVGQFFNRHRPHEDDPALCMAMSRLRPLLNYTKSVEIGIKQ